MTGRQVERLRTALVEERDRVAAAIDNIHNVGPAELEPAGERIGTNHPADIATDTLEREIDSTLEESAVHLLQEIDAALVRIESGTYGICAGCGRPIGVDRLEAMPWAAFCIDCQRRDGR